MSKITKGLQQEIYFSNRLHSLGIPLLVEPRVLQSRGCGQVDIARIDQNKNICIFEIKSSRFITRAQKVRLRKSAIFLSSVFDMPCRLSVIFGCLSKH